MQSAAPAVAASVSAVTTLPPPGSTTTAPVTTVGGATTTILPGTTTTTSSGATTTTPLTTTTTVAHPTTSVAHTTTTVAGLAHPAAAATTTTTPAVAAPSALANDRGVIHQAVLNLGGSKSAAHTAQIYLDAPIKVLVILVVAFILARLVSRLSHRLVNGLRLVSPLVQATPRGAARVQTLAGAFTSVFRALIWIVAFLEILNEFSINLVPFVATATVIGAAVGFGAQTLVKDFLSGVLLLAEDQYGVGDHIAVGTGVNLIAGTVESVNLRVTRLRGLDGGVLYIPNGDIRTLSNDTETDSQAVVDILVPFGTDLLAAGISAQETARRMAEESDWEHEFTGPPYFAGVPDASGANGITIRMVALTRPGQHMRVGREMRLRIADELRRSHIAWAPDDATPAPTLGAEQVSRARAEQRQAERETVARIRRASIAGSRPTARAAARRAVARRIAARRADQPSAPPAPPPPGSDAGDSEAAAADPRAGGPGAVGPGTVGGGTGTVGGGTGTGGPGTVGGGTVGPGAEAAEGSGPADPGG
ncbi:MAG: mechanosensitive ion channel family protein [Acidobacteriota bacterium]|nr:mechanosensitive ion channel family protein [Acidobacteriota bacterium]